MDSLPQQPAAAPAIIPPRLPPLSTQIGEKKRRPRKKMPISSDGEEMVFPAKLKCTKPWKKASERSAPATGPKAVKKRQPRAKKEKAGMVSPDLGGMAVKAASLINNSALLDELLAAPGAAKKQALEVPSQSTTQTPVVSNAYVQGAACEQNNEHQQGEDNEQIVQYSISVNVSAVAQPEPPPPAVSPSGESFLAQQNSAHNGVPSTIDCSGPSAVQDSDDTTTFDSCNNAAKIDDSVGYSNDTGGTYANSASFGTAKTTTTDTTAVGNTLTSAYLDYYLQQAKNTGNNLLNNTSNLTNSSFGNNSLSGCNSNIYAGTSDAYSGTNNAASSYTNNALGLAGYGAAMGAGTGTYNTSAYVSTPSYNSTTGLSTYGLNNNFATLNTNNLGDAANSSYGMQQQSLLGTNASSNATYNALLQSAGLSGYGNVGSCNYSSQLQSGYNTSGYGGSNTSSYGTATTGTGGYGGSNTLAYGTAATGTSGYGGSNTSSYGPATTFTSNAGTSGNINASTSGSNNSDFLTYYNLYLAYLQKSMGQGQQY